MLCRDLATEFFVHRHGVIQVRHDMNAQLDRFLPALMLSQTPRAALYA